MRRTAFKCNTRTNRMPQMRRTLARCNRGAICLALLYSSLSPPTTVAPGPDFGREKDQTLRCLSPAVQSRSHCPLCSLLMNSVNCCPGLHFRSLIWGGRPF